MNGLAPQEPKNAPKAEVLEYGKTIFTSKGVALELSGISPLLIAKVQSIGKLPDVPTRRIALDFDIPEGEEPVYQEEELTEDDLRDEIERKLWKAYTEERDAVLEKRNDGFLKAIFSKGVTVDLSKLDLWRASMEYLGIEVSDNPIAQKVDYIQTEALGNTDDMMEIIIGVLGESGIGEEDLAGVRASFRRSVRRAAPGEAVDSEGQMDLESGLYGDESGTLLGDMASERLLSGE